MISVNAGIFAFTYWLVGKAAPARKSRLDRSRKGQSSGNHDDDGGATSGAGRPGAAAGTTGGPRSRSRGRAASARRSPRRSQPTRIGGAWSQGYGGRPAPFRGGDQGRPRSDRAMAQPCQDLSNG